jgi:hypothetical protein
MMLCSGWCDWFCSWALVAVLVVDDGDLYMGMAGGDTGVSLRTKEGCLVPEPGLCLVASSETLRLCAEA